MRLRAVDVAIVLPLLGMACGGSNSGFQGIAPVDAATPPVADAGAADVAAPPPQDDDAGPGTGFGDAAPPPPPEGKALVYVHDDTSLYSVDPTDPQLAVTKLGDFDCVSQTKPQPADTVNALTDIAVDKSGRLFGIASSRVFLDMKLNGTTVACKNVGVALVAPSSASANAKFYGASFAPAGTLDPSAETLIVGNTMGELYAVDTTSGNITLVGTLGTVPHDDGNGHTFPHAGKTWELSGDIVFVANGGAPIGYATVRDCANPPSSSSCNAADTLVEIDVTKLSAAAPVAVVKSVRGQVVKAAGCGDPANSGYGSMYGIAAFGKDVFGFSRAGFVVRIDAASGQACLVADDTSIFVPPNKGFDGAGVTTLAPVVVPPPK